MDRLTAAEVFITIVERGSMVAAAEALDMSRSMVTRYLAQMEDWAGTRLLHRSTRSLSLTAAGEQALQHCQQLLTVSHQLSSGLTDSEEQPKGLLRISCSQFAAQHLLQSSLYQFQEQYPLVGFDLQIRNERVNLVEERIDLAIRVTNDLDPNIIARPLGNCRSVICATPAYLQRVGTPLTPDQLSNHNCLLYANFGKSIWPLLRNDEPVNVAVKGNLSSNDTTILLRAALDHQGISMLPHISVTPYLASGELVSVLPEYEPQTMGIYAIYRSRSHMPKALRLLIDLLAEQMPTLGQAS